MKTQTIRTTEMTLPPLLGRPANPATHNLTGAASYSTDATSQREVTLKSRGTDQDHVKVPSWSRNATALRSLAVAIIMVLAILDYATAQTGPWTTLTNKPSFGADMGLLLTDGTVMVHDGWNNSQWWKLSPDQYGNYVNGTWSQLASLPSGYSPLYFASAVLADGRVIIEGGEYNPGGGHTNLGAIFDPTVVDKASGKMLGRWTAVSPPTDPNGNPWPYIGDAPSVVLADGTFMLGSCCDKPKDQWDALLTGNPLIGTKNPWTPTGLNKVVYNSEEGYTLLPDGSVLTLNNDWAAQYSSGVASERYLPPPVGIWIPAGATCADLFQNNGSTGEIGPAILRPDGTVFAAGSSSSTSVPAHTCIYHTSLSDPDYLTWTVSPNSHTMAPEMVSG